MFSFPPLSLRCFLAIFNYGRRLYFFWSSTGLLQSCLRCKTRKQSGQSLYISAMAASISNARESTWPSIQAINLGGSFIETGRFLSSSGRGLRPAPGLGPPWLLIRIFSLFNFARPEPLHLLPAGIPRPSCQYGLGMPGPFVSPSILRTQQKRGFPSLFL